MAKKKTARKATRVARGTGDVLREAWATTQKALVSAEGAMETQVKGLLKKNKIDAREAKAMVKDLGARVEKERKKALKQIEGRVATFQARMHKERKVVGRMVNDAVKNTLAAFNIPSRAEVAELTRQVEALSKKIDGLKRRR
jgi:polyhydroxyalkanoate synthesis regulator phasin